MINLSTLKNATKQQVFDQVVEHLLTQKKKSRAYNGGCCYRITIAGSELKCAAGCLISDQEFKDLDLSKYNIDIWDELIKAGYAPRKHGKLITALQDMHDREGVRDWYDSLEYIARNFRLNKKTLNKFTK